MKTTCEKLVASYMAWIAARFSTASVNGACEITTPFLDRHNDKIQVFVEERGDQLWLTDDGYMLADLEASGCGPDTEVRQQLLQVITNGFNVGEQEGELCSSCSAADFPFKLHSLIQAMLSVNRIVFTARQRIVKSFAEELGGFLEESAVNYVPGSPMRGRSEIEHRFDYLVPRTGRSPDRYLRAISTPNKEQMTATIFAWVDTEESRATDSLAYAILNDDDRRPSDDVVNALSKYNIRPVLWSQRQQIVPDLTAA